MSDMLVLVEKLHIEQQTARRSSPSRGVPQDVNDDWEQRRSDLLQMGFDPTLLKGHERQIETFFMEILEEIANLQKEDGSMEELHNLS